MKKNLFILSALGLSAATALTLSSCRDYDVFEEEVAIEVAKVKEFNHHFIERFGEPDPNHTWGTDKVLTPMFPGATRAAGKVEVNRNQWCEIQSSSGSGASLSVSYKPEALINRVKVPGWPNDDGFFYTSGGAGALQNIYNLSEVVSNRPQPVGDVTDYEVQFVSTWFRTHKNPENTALHLTDFFVQNVSCDNDQLWYDNSVDGYGTTKTGSLGLPVNTLGGMSTPGYNGPTATHTNDVLTASGEATYRTDYDGHPTLAPQIKRVDQSKNSNEELNYRMDYLHFGNMNTSKIPSNFDSVGDDWTHINNFNRGNSNYNPEESDDRNFREIKYVHSSGTENFACRPSMGIERNWISDWVLVRLDWEEVMADGNTHHRYGYYLGFDFATRSGSTEISPDGYYSNWIIKITPAYLTSGTHSARVMCEDLGGSFDFDFNDVVFDVAYDNTTNENIICLQAAGGTLPLYVGKYEDKYEAHKMLGQSDLVPTNVIEGGTKHEVAIYRIPAVSTDAARDDYAYPIYVKQDGTLVNVNGATTNIPQKDDYEWKEDNQTTHDGHYEPTSDKIPRKFVTEVGVKWAIELAGIDKAYDRFHEWVADAKFKYDNPNGNGDLFWFNSPSKFELIYDYYNNIVVSTNGSSQSAIKQWLSLDVIGIAEDFVNQGLATEIISFGKYENDENSLIKQMTNKGANKEQITFAYIMKAKEGEIPAGVMIPVWIDDNKAYHVGSDGTKTQITSDMISQDGIYTNATWQPNFSRNDRISGTPQNAADGIDAGGYKTYINKFSFESKDLKDDTGKWCDYIMFFCKQKYDDSSSTNYNGGSTSKFTNPAKNNGNVIWYETYSIL